jgi:hypothetical protein
MARKMLAWLVVFGLMGPAGAQVGAERGDIDEARPTEDIPDNMDEFRRTPHTDDSPVTSELEEGAGVGGSGTASTREARGGEVSGEVVRVEGQQLFLRHAGSVFPLTLTEETRFTPDRRQALQPGREVRARFTLEDGNYVVDALEPVREAPKR